MTDATIRRAGVADASRLVGLATRTFVDTFAEFNDPADMDLYIAKAFSLAGFEDEIADPLNTWLIAEIDDDLAGYAKVRSGIPHESVTGDAPIELARLYAEQRFHGRGVGRALLEACFAEASRRGARTMWLGVWEHNARAIAFYQKHGFSRCGATTFVLGTDVQTDLVMARSL